MAVVQSMARNFFSAWEEFNDVRADSPTPDWVDNHDQKLPDRSALQNLFAAYEKFNLPSHHTSHESLPSLASSTNSSCSDFNDLISRDASFQAKVFHALQRVTIGNQRPSRLPFAPTEPHQQNQLSFEELSMMKKLLVAFQEFVNPQSDQNDPDNNAFPKFC